MLVFGPHVNCQRARCRACTSPGLSVHSAFKRTTEVVGNRLSEVITVCQRRPADRHDSRVNRLHVRREIPSSTQQILLVGKFPLQAGLQIGCARAGVWILLQVFVCFFCQSRAFHARPRLHSSHRSRHVTKRRQFFQNWIHPAIQWHECGSHALPLAVIFAVLAGLRVCFPRCSIQPRVVMRAINMLPHKPSDGASDQNVRREVLLRGQTRHAHG